MEKSIADTYRHLQSSVKGLASENYLSHNSTGLSVPSGYRERPAKRVRELRVAILKCIIVVFYMSRQQNTQRP